MTDQTEREKLLPCPFCGNEPFWESSYRIECGNCRAQLGRFTEHEEPGWHEIIARMWNTRAALDGGAVSQDAINTIEQAIMEVRHAQEVGASWYTKGARGLYQQVRMHLDRATKAIAALRTQPQPQQEARDLALINFVVEQAMSSGHNKKIHILSSNATEILAAFLAEQERE